MAENFYALLEVPRDASQDEIRDAFREKVRVYHPDHNDDPRANAQFTAVKKAYDTLGDPVERNAYDRMGHLDYVAKRLDGLPDPEKWAPSEVDDGASSGATGSASGTTGTTGSTGSGRSSGRTGSRRSGSADASSTGTSSGGRTSGSGGASASTTASGAASGRRTASDGAGATASTGRTGTDSRRSRQPHQSPIVSWIARHGIARRLVGWPLLWIAVFVYAAGLAAVASTITGPLAALVDRLSAAGTDPGALSAALERGDVPTVFDAAVGPLRAAGGAEPVAVAGGLLLIAGALLLPAVVALLVYLTRMSPGWRPTYLYAVASLGPAVALAVGAAVAPPLSAELALVLVLPLGGLVVMLLSAFVRPRVKAALFG